MAGRPLLRPLRQREDQRGSQPEADALLVHGLPELLLGEDWNGDAAVQDSAAQVGHRHLPLPDQPQERVQHEAAPRPKGHAEDRLVHGASHPRGVAHDAYFEERPFSGPVEADETFIGGKEKKKHLSQRRNAGRGPVGKMAVVGVKDRATRNVRVAVAPDTTGPTLRGFVESNATPEAMVYTDGEPAYASLSRQHEAVKHSVGEYVRGMAHTNGMESFWSMLKRAHMGTFHKLSPKHLDRYVQEFAGRHNVRDLGTVAQMRDTVMRIVGRNLLYADLIADNGLDSGARS